MDQQNNKISRLWDFMFRKDDWFLNVIYFLSSLRGRFNYKHRSLMSRIAYRHNNEPKKSLFLILNGPSLKKQNISILKGKDVMFVNRGFMHPDYELLKPRYHVFVDSKMAKGIWPVDWLNEIWAKSPDTKILLPAEWYLNHRFKAFRGDERILWIADKLPFNSLGVAGECFIFAIKENYSKLFFTGFDANGIAVELLQQSESHFYGEDEELKGRNSLQFAQGLYMHARHLRDWYRMGDYCRKQGIKVYNFSEGGLIDNFEMATIKEVLSLS